MTSPWVLRARAGSLPAKSLDDRRETYADRGAALTIADLQARIARETRQSGRDDSPDDALARAMRTGRVR